MKGNGRTIKFTAVMRWCQPSQQWFMYSKETDKFVMNLFDCENINKIFPRMKKDKDNKYNVTIKMQQAA